MAFEREAMRRRAMELAQQGVFLGTSSWKYPGWRGMLYDDSRYVYRGKFAESRFKKITQADTMNQPPGTIFSSASIPGQSRSRKAVRVDSNLNAR